MANGRKTGGRKKGTPNTAKARVDEIMQGRSRRQGLFPPPRRQHPELEAGASVHTVGRSGFSKKKGASICTWRRP